MTVKEKIQAAYTAVLRCLIYRDPGTLGPGVCACKDVQVFHIVQLDHLQLVAAKFRLPSSAVIAIPVFVRSGGFGSFGGGEIAGICRD